MKIYVGQIYIEPEASFPFSHLMQVWLGQQLSELVTLSDAFRKKFGADFSLGIRISARVSLDHTEIKGPTRFKREKDVEYTLFLPFQSIQRSPDGCRAAVRMIVDGIDAILQMAGLDADALRAKRAEIVDHICADPSMLTETWPPSGSDDHAI